MYYISSGLKLPEHVDLSMHVPRFCLTDNHDIVSLKLYELTVIRSEKEEKEEEEEITIPSVDNMDLLRRKTNTHLYICLSINTYLLTSFFFFPATPVEEGMSSVGIFFTVLFSMLGGIFLIIIGLVVYSQWKESRRKRFY